MKLSTEWLENFVSLDGITPHEVASKLTMSAFEVEEIQKIGPNLKGPIVVGKILDIQKHPNADKLSVCKVTTDGKNALQIVCGAKNIKAGQLVPVSLPGSKVINRQDGSEVLIKNTKIREIDSSGMLCSPGELGITREDPNGILILSETSENAKLGLGLGVDVINYLSLNKDTVMEVASRSNRGDALSVYGLSKEISALTSKKLKEITFKTPVFDNSVESFLPKIENLKDTYVFYTATIENIKVATSPMWLTRLLESVGIRSINNIVDITNYINFAFGQPLHAYDKAMLQGKKGKTLVSRLAKKGEKIQTLDGKLVELKEGVLVIADEEKPVAIAGIMGGKYSEVTENTKDIVFEAAVFNPARVRRGSRTVGLSSEASKRFERGVDTNFTYNALLKTIELVCELSSTKTKTGKIQQSGSPIDNKTKIILPLKEVKRVLGINLKPNETANFLKSLGFSSKILDEENGGNGGNEGNGGKIEVIAPTSRQGDVTRPVDLIEEVARLYGYDQIPSLPPPATVAANVGYNGGKIEKIKRHFLGCGFSEACLSSLIGEQLLSYSEFPFDKSRAISMINPLSKEHYVLRQWILPGLLEALKLNQSHQTLPVRFFEIGKVYFSHNKPTEKDSGVKEILRISGIISDTHKNWLNAEDKSIFFTLKGVLESLLSGTNYKFERLREKFLHPNFSLKIILNNKEIGLFGCLHPTVENTHEIINPTVVFEVDLDSFLIEIEKNKVFEKISSQPIVQRDITIDLSKKYDASNIINEIIKIKSAYVIDVCLISVYELDKENRSLTYRLKMQDFEQTLTTKQIEDEVISIKKHLTACFQAKFRV